MVSRDSISFVMVVCPSAYLYVNALYLLVNMRCVRIFDLKKYSVIKKHFLTTIIPFERSVFG